MRGQDPCRMLSPVPQMGEEDGDWEMSGGFPNDQVYVSGASRRSSASRYLAAVLEMISGGR